MPSRSEAGTKRRSLASYVRLATRIVSRSTSFSRAVAAASALFRQVCTSHGHRWLTHNHLSILNHPLSPILLCSGRLPNTTSKHCTPLTPEAGSPPTSNQPHPASLPYPSVAWIRARRTHRLTPALRAPQEHHHTRRDFGAASSLMCHIIRVSALLLTLGVCSC